MIENVEHYGNINLSELRLIIREWAEGRPSPRVTLYRSRECKTPYVLIAELPPLPETKMERRRAYKKNNPSNDIQYPTDLDFSDEENAIIEAHNSTLDSCLHLNFDRLYAAYRDSPPSDYYSQWMWVNIDLGTSIKEEYGPDFVHLETRYVLYGTEQEANEKVRAGEPEPAATETPITPQQATPNGIDPESFIRALQVSYLDNTEVKIQHKGKHKNYTCESMGFRDSNTEEWKTFLKILNAMDDNYREHTYRLGPAHYINKKTHQKARIGEYDKKLNLLKEIDKKLISFLTKHYNVAFPVGFKSYERQPAKGKGIYSFKFQIPSAPPSYKTKDQALKYLEVLVRDHASNELINEACLTALDEGASTDEVSRIVQDVCALQLEHLESVDDLEKGDENELD